MRTKLITLSITTIMNYSLYSLYTPPSLVRISHSTVVIVWWATRSTGSTSRLRRRIIRLGFRCTRFSRGRTFRHIHRGYFKCQIQCFGPRNHKCEYECARHVDGQLDHQIVTRDMTMVPTLKTQQQEPKLFQLEIP